MRRHENSSANHYISFSSCSDDDGVPYAKDTSNVTVFVTSLVMLMLCVSAVVGVVVFRRGGGVLRRGHLRQWFARRPFHFQRMRD